MKLIITQSLLFASFIVLMITGVKATFGQTSKNDNENQPKVVKAVAPGVLEFLRGKSVVEIVIEVSINQDGRVVSAKLVEETEVEVTYKNRSGYFKKIAKMWEFEKSSNSALRSARIKFVFRMMPKGTISSELITIIRLPYEIEIRKLDPLDKTVEFLFDEDDSDI